MSYVTRAVALLLFCGMSACAPVMLGRTPTPAAPGETKLSAAVNYPVGLTEPPAPKPSENRLFGENDPAYSPLPLPLSFRIAYGRNEAWETNLELMLSPGISGSVVDGTGFSNGNPLNVGARYGAKNRFQTEPVELAFDFGASLYAPGITFGADAGILAAVPLGDAKLYGGLRGFVGAFPGIGAAALTVGGEVPLEKSQSVMLELTLLVNRYNGASYFIGDDPSPPPPPQPIGFTLVPAITFNF